MAKMTKKGREFVSDEISHLMKKGPSKGPQKGKKMPQKQAVAVALDVARRKGFKTAPNPNKDESTSVFDALVENRSGSLFDGLVQESSLFDEIVDKSVDEGSEAWLDRMARTLTLAENLIEIRNTIKSK